MCDRIQLACSDPGWLLVEEGSCTGARDRVDSCDSERISRHEGLNCRGRKVLTSFDVRRRHVHYGFRGSDARAWLFGRKRFCCRVTVFVVAESQGQNQSMLCQIMYWPPFAVSVEPVMKPASSDARKTTQRAISSGPPSRPSGMCGRMFFSSTSCGTAFTISVAI